MKKGPFAGILQIVFSIFIFAGVITIAVLHKKNVDFQSEALEIRLKESMEMRTVIADLQKNFPLHEKSLRNLNRTLTPVKNGIDAIVNCRDYSVMGKKPFYAFCNSFTGLQQALGEIQDSLGSAQLSFHKLSPEHNKAMIALIDRDITFLQQAQIQHQNNLRIQKYIFLMTLGIYILFGLGLLVNGICCIREG